MDLYVKDLIIILNNIIGIGKLEFVWNKYIVVYGLVIWIRYIFIYNIFNFRLFDKGCEETKII